MRRRAIPRPGDSRTVARVRFPLSSAPSRTIPLPTSNRTFPSCYHMREVATTVCPQVDGAVVSLGSRPSRSSGHQHVSGAGRRWLAAGGSPACRYTNAKFDGERRVSLVRPQPR